MVGQFVLVRSYASGVHCGVLVSRNGQEVELKDSRRVHRWRGPNTLNEMSLSGCASDYTRISQPVPQIVLTEACEVIPCADAARENLSQSRWGT